MPTTAVFDTVAASAQRKITRRLIPFLFLLYVTGFIDRVNVSFAGLDLTRELHFSNEVFGFGAGIFLWILQGDPATYINSYSEQNDVDLIMMPPHGYGTFRSLLIGSVTAKVLDDAKCPVWTSTHTEDPDLITHLRCKNILCAVDLSGSSAALIRYAAELADRYKAELRLVHAVPGAEPYPEQGFGRFLRQAAHEELAKLQQQSGTNFEADISGRDLGCSSRPSLASRCGPGGNWTRQHPCAIRAAPD